LIIFYPDWYKPILCETWVKPSEFSLLQNNIDSHAISKDNSYIVFNKSGMSEDDEHSAGRPYGGVAIICKVSDGLSYEIINTNNSRIIAVLIKDRYDRPLHIILCVICLTLAVAMIKMSFCTVAQNATSVKQGVISALQAIIQRFKHLFHATGVISELRALI